MVCSLAVVMASCPMQDWWNCESYATYYRKWNVPIHDWLHAYLFQDLKPVSCSWMDKISLLSLNVYTFPPITAIMYVYHCVCCADLEA